MAKCVICGQRPERVDGYCKHCFSQLEAVRNAKDRKQPRHFLTYQGHVVGLFPNGGKTLVARLLARSDKYLPKRKTVNLNSYCTGYSRDSIKAFKACIRQLSQA